MDQSTWIKMLTSSQVEPDPQFGPLIASNQNVPTPLNNNSVNRLIAMASPGESPAYRSPLQLQEYSRPTMPQRAPAYISEGIEEPASPTLSPLDEMLRERMGGIQGMQQQIEDIEANPTKRTFANADLSMLGSWADSLAGTNLSSTYKAPQFVSDEEKIAKLREAIAKEQGGVADDLVQMKSLEDANSRHALQMALEREKMGNALRIAGMKDNDKEGKPKELTQNMIKTINEGNAIPDMLNDVASVIEGNLDIFDPIKGNVSLYNPYNNRIQSVNSQITSVSQLFGKFMEGGVLRKEDEAKYRRMFPNVGDTPKVAENKLKNVRRILIQKQNSDLEAFRAQGYNLTGLDKGFETPSLAQQVLGTSAQPEAQNKGPRVGVIEDGYRFKGGNPNDPSNWERL